jgi:hypothetical protein
MFIVFEGIDGIARGRSTATKLEVHLPGNID